jgi:hypothetical protein
LGELDDTALRSAAITWRQCRSTSL